MKKSLSFLALGLLLTTASTSFAATKITAAEKTKACQMLSKIIPTEQGRGLSVEKCLKTFTFDVAYSSDVLKVIELTGQTVEDRATICTVSLVNLSLDMEIETPAPSCVLE